MEYLRLVCSRALRETKKLWTPQRMWVAFLSPVVTVPIRGLFYGWTMKDLGFTAVVTLLVVCILWGLTFLFDCFRAPALIYREQRMTIQEIPRSGTPSERPQPAPRLVVRGPLNKACPFPVPDERYTTRPLDCVVLAVRNSADSSADEADNVIAHLDFESDTAPTVHIDEGWWCEDQEDTGSNYSSIGRDETRHLVIAIQADHGCFAVPKEFKSYHGRNMPGDPIALPVGHHRVTVEITAESVRESFYLDAKISEDGKISWSTPMTARPSAWPKLR